VGGPDRIIGAPMRWNSCPRHLRDGLVWTLLLISLGSGCARSPAPDEVAWAIAIHGGAGTIPRDLDPESRRRYEDSLREALTLGRDLLESGGRSLDAVERVIVYLEDDPLFNAGRGAVFNAAGGNELDASLMDGASMAAGAVAGVTSVKNPITLARLVMTETPHVLLAGAGAEELAREHGLESVGPDYFWTQRRWDELQRRRAAEQGGTVGAVALDRAGNLAAGTSTGGLTAKRFGRIGDSPIVGAGTYADNATCAVSGTGKGEEFIRHNVAARISMLVGVGGLELEPAAQRVIGERLDPGDGGVIAVDRDGRLALVFNTEGMYRGAADSSGRFEVAIWD